MSHNVRNRTVGLVRLAMIQISLRIHKVWSESSMYACCIAKDAKFLHADNKDTNLTVRMHRLIWVFVAHMSDFGRTVFWYCRKRMHLYYIMQLKFVTRYIELIQTDESLFILPLTCGCVPRWPLAATVVNIFSQMSTKWASEKNI